MKVCNIRGLLVIDFIEYKYGILFSNEEKNLIG